MIDAAIFVGIDFDILLTAGQLQPGKSILLRVDVPTAAHRIKPGVELYIVGGSGINGQQTFVIAEFHRLALLTLADIDGLPLDPPFGIDLLGYFLKSLVAIFAEIVDDYILRAVHLPDLPISDVAHAVVHTLDNHGDMISRRSGQREYRILLIIDSLDDKQTLYHAFHSIELEVIDPFLPGVLSWTVLFSKPETFPEEIGVVIDIKFDMVVMCEGKREDAVALHLLDLRRAVIR